MGGGKDQKQANTQLTQQAQYQSGQQKSFDTRNEADLNASRGRGDELYGSLKAGYEGLSGGPNLAAGTAGAGGGGGYQAPALDPRYQGVEDQYKNFMDTGGWEPDVRKAQQGRIDTLTEFGKTGGLTEEEKARARGGGLYEEFSKTGGWNDRDIANARARGTSGIPAMYDRIKQEQARGQAISGGFGPGAGVLAGRMARQQQAGIAGASRDTELGIKEQVNKGRQWGGEGLERSELNLQELLSKNKLQGTQAGSDIQGKMMESIMGGRQWGTGGMKGLADEEMARRERQAAASAAGSASAAANDKWATEFGLKQKLAGLEGLGSLYTTSPEEYQQNKELMLRSAGGFGETAGDLGSRLKTGNTSAWDRVAQVGGAVAGGLSGAGSLGWKPFKG